MSEDAPLRANPYVGLRPFFADDALYFYGREPQTEELLAILRDNRFLGVVGSSGSGKSSLVRAGLLPALLAGFLVRDHDSWKVAQIRPGDAPIANLAAGLVAATGGTVVDAAALERAIRDEHTDAIVAYVAPLLPPNANLLLLVDQFEELFAFRSHKPAADTPEQKERARREAEAGDFADLLMALAGRADLPAYVVLTMRTDFLGDCDLFYGLPEALNRARYLVPRMTREQLRDAVECPALLAGAQVAPRLLDRLLNELGDRFDRLPVLQHALLRTWDEWWQGGALGAIDLAQFDAVGGLERALNDDADRAMAGLDAGVVERMFKRLVDTDASGRRIRSPARIAELTAASGAEAATIAAVLDAFEGDGRVFVHRSDDGEAGNPRVDISHESLIRQWDRLWRWSAEEARARDEYRELVRRARRWAQGSALPLEGPELNAVADWQQANGIADPDTATVATPSPGWAGRYDEEAGDYAAAIGYVGASVALRRDALTEDELQRRWREAWLPALLAIEVPVVLWWAWRQTNLFRKANPVSPGEPVIWDFVSSVIDVGKSPQFVLVLLSVGLCFGFNLAAKRLYRIRARPGIERDYAAYGWGIERFSAGWKDALEVHDTIYASTLRRAIGFGVDWSLLLLMVPFYYFGMAYALSMTNLSDGDLVLLGAVGGLAAFCWLYTTLSHISKHRGTPGMRLAGIFRTDLQGQRLTFGRATALYAFRLLSYLFYGFGFFLQPFTPKRQTFHDRMARTVVLRRPRKPAAGP